MMQRCSRFSLFVACALALAGSLAFARPAQVDARTTEANVARVTASLLASSQLSHHPLDKQLAGKLLERYLDALDPGRSVLLKSDEAEFGAAAARLADSLWTEEVRAEVLAEKLADKPAPGGPANALIRRHEQELKNISKLNDNDV